MEQHLAAGDARKAAHLDELVPRLSAPDALQAFEAAGGTLHRCEPGDVLAWIEDWRRSRSGPALSHLYEHLINPLGEREVPLRVIIGMLGRPDSVTPSFAYYSRNADGGLVLHADADGYLSGRRLN